MSHVVSEFGLEYLREKTDRIAKRAAKMKVHGLTLQILSTNTATLKDGTVSMRYEVDLVGKSPVAGPYVLIAVKEMIKEDTYIRTVPGEAVPTWFQGRDMMCDHCCTNRRRNEVFIVMNKDNNKHLQVGRNCITDFLGVDASSWLQQAEWILEIQEMYEMADIFAEDEHRGQSVSRYLPWDKIFVYVYSQAQRHGFVSKKKAYEDDSLEATITAALHNFYTDMGAVRGGYRKDQEPPPTPEEELAADKILAWFGKEVLPDNEKHYFGDDTMWYNLDNMYANNLVPLKLTGLAVIPYVVWNIVRQNELRNQKQAVESKWLGELGKKVTIQVKLHTKQALESDAFGITMLHKFVSKDGDRISWFQSAGSSFFVEEGEELIITGNVKAHKEFRGIKETVLKGVKRCLK